MPAPKSGRRADAGRPVEDYVGYLFVRGKLSQAQYLAACLVRQGLEPGAQTSAVAREVRGPMTAGAAEAAIAARVDARRRLMRLVAAMPAHVQPVFLHVVVQQRSLSEMEPSRRERVRLIADLQQALDIAFDALADGAPGGRRQSGR